MIIFNDKRDRWPRRQAGLYAVAFIAFVIILLSEVTGQKTKIDVQRKKQQQDESKKQIVDMAKLSMQSFNYSGQHGVYLTPEFDSDQMVPAARLTDEQRLMQRLFREYDRFARPVFNLTDAVTISMSLTITQIFELDEMNQVLITNAWANLEWIDQYMRWDPEEFSGLTMVRIMSSKLWLPDIVLYNNAADFSPNVLETRAMVTNNGLVFWSVPTKLFSSCKIDVTFFPFDEQKCRMKFGSWTYDGFKVDLVNSSTTADLSLYMKSGEWDLVSADQKRNVVVYTCCAEPYPDVTFYLHIKRKPLYYTINVFLPCLMMSALTLLVFLLPAESGEKCGLGITIMLSFAVFMLTVIEKLPDTSESFPLISVYLTVVMSMTAISIVITVSLLNLNHKSSRSAPVRPWLKKVLDSMSPFCCVTVSVPDSFEKEYQIRGADDEFFTIKNNRKRQGSVMSNLSCADGSIIGDKTAMSPVELLRLLTFELNETARASSEAGNSLGPSYHQVAMGLHRLLDREQREAQVMDSNATWRRLAQLIDRCLFWLLLFVATFFTVFLLIIYPSQKRL